MVQSQRLLIGRVTGVHGLAGNLKIWSFAESPDTFETGRQIRVRREGDAGPGDTHTIVRATPQKKGVLLTLSDVETREDAEAMGGMEILVDKDQLPELEADTWYWQDLIGLTVSDNALGLLGTVDRLFSTGADDILVVKDPNQADPAEILIPMNARFVTDVDLDRGAVTTDLPEGFILE